MQAICSGSNHGPSLRIGEELMNHLAYYDFRMGNEKLPMCRFALMVAMLTTKKHADGLARLIVKADLDKMKGPLKEKCRDVEKLLLEGWQQCQRSTSPEPVKTTAFGHLAVRLVLHLLGKEKWGREDGYASFSACVEQFGDDLKGKTHSSSPSAPEEGSSGVVTDLLTAKPKEKALLAHPNIAVGGKYLHKDHGDQIFELMKIEDDGAFFVHVPIFGMPVEVKAGLDALNEWKKTKKEPHLLLESDIVKKRLPHNAPVFAEEALKAEAQHLLFQAYQHSSKPSEDQLGFAYNPHGLVCLKKVKKKGLQLYPIGLLGKFKEGSKATYVVFKGSKFSITHLKTWNPTMKPEDPGMLCPYFAIKSTDDSDWVNMHMIWVQYEGLRLPILENPDGLDEETYLYKGQEDLKHKDDVEPQPKKRLKK